MDGIDFIRQRGIHFKNCVISVRILVGIGEANTADHALAGTACSIHRKAVEVLDIPRIV